MADSTGRRYLDATAGLWYCNVGHGRAELAEAAAQQMRSLAAYQTFDFFANEPALKLADRICELAPLGDGSVAFFVSGGSDAVDTAGKIARRYWALAGQPERQVIVARDGAYHGMHAYGTSLAGIEANAAGWGQLVASVRHLPYDSVGSVEALFAEQGSKIAAFIGEPVQGAGGVRPPPPGYWEGVTALCREHDILLIADEVITGFGRVGHWFGSQRYGIEPDMILTAKGITSGYMPLGAVIASKRLRDAFWAESAGVLRHGYTYSGHPVACAVALENLAIIEREGLVERVRELERHLTESLAPLAEHPAVHEVRTAGLLAAVELSEDARSEHPGLVDTVVSGARERNVLTRNLVGKSLQISPPFVIEPDEIQAMAAVLSDSIEAATAPSAAASSR